MSTKIDVRQLIKDHLSTMRDANTGLPSLVDVFVFFALPILASVGLVWLLEIELSKGGIELLTTVFSILTGLLLNLLVLIFDLSAKSRDQVEAVNREAGSNPNAYYGKLGAQKLIKETYVNISFEILVSLFVLGLLSLSLIDSTKINTILSLLIFSLVGHFLLTLLMIIKRMHVLMGRGLSG